MGSIELAYNLSAKDRVRIRAVLDRRSLKRQNSALHLFTSPRLALITDIILWSALVSWMVRVWPTFVARDWAEILRLSNVLGYVFALGITWHLVNRIRQFSGRHWGREKALRAGRKGVSWGGHNLSVTPKALTIRLAARTAVYSWAAFSGLEKTKHMLLLMLTPRSAVAIPRRAFESKTDELTFCDFVQRQIRSS